VGRRIQRIYYDTAEGEVRTTVFDGSFPLEGARRRRAGVAIPHPTQDGYLLYVVDGSVHDRDERGEPFLTKASIDQYEERYVQAQVLPQPGRQLPGLSAEVLT
jgi:hypothetical protein